MKKIIYVVNADDFFVSHRLPLAKAAQAKGYDVTVITELSTHKKHLKDEGFHLVHCPFKTSFLNPFKALHQLLTLYKTYAKIKPDVVHHITIKPVLLGGLAAFMMGKNKPKVVSALTGLGYSYTSTSFFARALSTIANLFFRLILKSKRSKLILQNPDDIALMLKLNLVREQDIVLIRGSGVDTQKYTPQPFPPFPPMIAMFASRLLKDKGIFDFTAAARLIKAKNLPISCVIVGDIDLKNPSSLKESDLNALIKEGIVTYLGHQKNMMAIWPQCHVAVLPSYREGLPKALLEAAALGRPIITTDAPGCREVVDHGLNGFLVPVKSPATLAEALEKMLDEKLRAQMGAASRAKVSGDLSLHTVISKTLALYESDF